MRIVGGKYKGRIFSPGKKMSGRPTTDIAKEGLFNILENRIDFSDKTVLDLFSGTGSMGYEFVSRGAQEVTFVEKNFHHYQFILGVIKKLQIDNVRAFKTDVFKFLFKFQGQFDIVFADPPFDLPQFTEVPAAVFSGNVLKNKGLFILEHPREYSFTSHPNFKEIRNYGKVNFSFFEA
ncbi:16S rRNA (guanine(966)-N(2))-methyltransferase RsmD [Maribellus comscasis]|uniref:16S rRNA (Guanine(966)-N(2))-methyltransferase RsmD n=1 Tax=Maribellus comscasis TaxID=2681766 RepID=A0A6I6JZ27_9BACT|nr:16S rRNA (guanine(966)-N(2))-methyltransferase RsmD [Maribellus comscasis]QGY45452.1 16S rRNA (guanine(966)-N(2))-methyltransferase RsmD [Maribellus comscasis]